MDALGLNVSDPVPATVWLDDVRAYDVHLVGNKASGVAWLLSHGYRVPAGFCVTAPALANASNFGWRAEVEERLNSLPGPWVARSSSTAEDSAGLAFPGMFATVLGLREPAELLAAVERVRDSANAEHVERYARHHGVHSRPVQMAVLIQTQVTASRAGVAFSRHPVTGARDVVIEGNYGLGETVVDGSVTPDGVVVTPDGTVEAVRIGSKQEKLVMTEWGPRRIQTSHVERKESSIDADLARELAVLVRRLERERGVPQDVEWAVDGGKIYLLQARPITTLPPEA